MKVYLGIKFYENNSNRHTIEGISIQLEDLGHKVFCVARDLEDWGANQFSAQDLMRKTFEEIDRSDVVLIEFSEKGVGLGIEAGYAFAKKIPIYIVAKKNAAISNTISGIATEIHQYENYSDIKL